MLFSLVLAVASKEVELWQTFDDFAPRRLMEEGEEEEVLMDDADMGDEEENLDGDEVDGDLIGEEEEGLNPLMIAVPAAAAVAVGAYFLMNRGQKENQEDKPLVDRLTVEGLKNDSEVQAAAGLTAAVTGFGLYALLSGGGATAPASAAFLSPLVIGLGTGGAGLAATGVAYKKGWWPFGGKTLTMEEYKKELETKEATALEKTTAYNDIKGAKLIEDKTKHDKAVADLEKKIKDAGENPEQADKDALNELKAKKTKKQIDAAKKAMEDAENEVTEYKKKEPKKKEE